MNIDTNPDNPPFPTKLANLYFPVKKPQTQDICGDWEEDEEELDEEWVRYMKAKREGRAKHAANYAKLQHKFNSREMR